MKKLNIPFFENNGDGNQCMQVGIQTAAKHFLNKDFTLAQLDELTGRKNNKWTYTPQIVFVMHEMGLDVEFYSKEELEPFLEGEPFFKRHFGEDADKILKFTDLEMVKISIHTLLKYDLFQKEIKSISFIESQIDKGYVPMVLIDYNVVSNKEGNYQGHFVVITGYDKEHIYYHENGPKNAAPHVKIKKEIFQKAINANGTDNDLVIVKGRRN